MPTDTVLAGDGDDLGLHRVLPDEGGRRTLPQQAERLDNDFTKRFANEVLVDVATLNIDAASFRQMEEAPGGPGVAELVQETVRRRGKQHNPVTGSGGMLVGRVAWIGPRAPDRGVSVGDEIATLASLSLTPLSISRIRGIRAAAAQVDVEGQAVIFASAPFARMPADLPSLLALSVLDVAGAAPQIARLARPGGQVLILGAGGKSGLLCAVEARRRVGPGGVVLGVEPYAPYAADLRGLGVCTHVFELDARDPIAVRDAVLGVAEVAARGGVDLSVSCVNTHGVEMSAILATRDRGCAYFFAMSTSFTAAALGAEGVGRDVDLQIGNGFATGHAEHTLQLIREEAPLRRVIEGRLSPKTSIEDR